MWVAPFLLATLPANVDTASVGGKVSLIEPQTIFCQHTTSLHHHCWLFNWCVIPPSQMRTVFSTLVSTQHKPAFPSAEMCITSIVAFLLSLFPPSPYSQGLILLILTLTLTGLQASSQLWIRISWRLCQSWAGSLTNYKAYYEESKSLIICSSYRRNTCRVLSYSNLTFLELHWNFFSWS